jgi:hypothetical protein
VKDYTEKKGTTQARCGEVSLWDDGEDAAYIDTERGEMQSRDLHHPQPLLIHTSGKCMVHVSYFWATNAV